MTSATINVNGLLSWDSQNVTVNQPPPGQPPSLVQTQIHGQFDVKGDTSFWGGADPAYFGVINKGHTTVNPTGGAGVHTIKGDFINQFDTTVNAGTLELAAKAEQEMGQFTLKNDATVKVSSPTGVLGIRTGGIIGQGKVDGNLVLGNNDGTGGGVITPGFDTLDNTGTPIVRGVGTITITGAFAIQSGGMQIDVNGAGLFDRVLVGSYAALRGGLSVTADQNYKPAAGTTLAFLVAQGGITGDFGIKYLPDSFVWNHPANPGRQHHWGAEKSPDWYSLIVKLPPGGQQPPGR